MKKCLKALVVALACLVLSLGCSVNAANLDIHTVSENEILGINTFRMNLPNKIYLDESSIKAYKAELYEKRFQGAGPFLYRTYRVLAPDAYISAVWTDAGFFNDGNGERAVNAVMTFTNFHSIHNYDLTGAETVVGLCTRTMSWLLLWPNGLYSDVQVYFYYKDDPNKEPIDMGNAYIGVGGQNSEKRMWNGTMEYNTDQARKYVHDLTAPDISIQGRQWEWVSYDRYLENKTLTVYKSDDCIEKYIRKEEKVYPKDNDIGGPYSIKQHGPVGNPYATTSPECTFDLTDGMINPTGFNVITNAGDRHDSNIDKGVDSYLTGNDDEDNSERYANIYNDKLVYMVQVGRVTDYTEVSKLKETTGRSDGKPFSVYNFTSGKDIGSVELGISPMALATEVKKPGKKVNKTTVHEQENLTYTITQQVGNMYQKDKRIDQRTKYTGLEVVDPLPKEVEFVSAVAKDSTGAVIATYAGGRQTSGAQNCVISYNATNNTLAYSFTSSYLNNTMKYVGEVYTFEINTKVKDLQNSDANDYIATNKATTYFSTAGTSRYPAETEEVSTQIIYDILTQKDEYSTISSMIPEIKGGENNKVVTFYPELGYYIDKVEWQTQSQRYAPTTALLSEITEIPAGGKVIPEVKNGTENTFKFVPTMDNNEGNTLNYDPFGTTNFTFNNVDNNHYIKVTTEPLKMVIDISKEDIETGKVTQGDAKFVGAQYTIYNDEALTSVADIVTLDAEGNGSSIELLMQKTDAAGKPYGEYYIKETKAPEGYLIDKTVYRVSETAEEQTRDREKVSHHPITSKELVIKSDVNVIKSLDKYPETTDSDPAEGCKLYLTLDSSKGAKVYEAVIDKYGYAAFRDIPYGWYTITESEEAREAGYKLMDPEPVYIEKDKKVHKVEYRRIIEENRIEYHVRVVKKDGDSATKSTIPVANTTYKIWDYQKEKYVEMVVTPKGLISEFKTDATGEFTTPEKLPIGRYRLVELTPPEGYHLNDTDFELKDAVFENVDEVPVITVNNEDIPQKAKIRVSKKAEVLTGVKQEKDEETGLEVLKPVYEKKGLQGVTYKVTAKENIVTADGTVRMSKGQAVYITTNSEGIAETEYLYLGNYEVSEYSTPTGYKLNTKVEDVTLDYRTNGRDAEGKLIVLDDYIVDLAYENERMPYELKFEKTYGESEYNSIGEEEKNSVRFGLYANEDIKVYGTNNIAIKKDALLEVIAAKDGVCEAKADIPVGSYYIKEIQVPNLPYEVDTEKYVFEFRPDATKEKEVITINDGVAIDNIVLKGTVRLLKITQKVYEANKEKIDEIIKNKDEEALYELAEEFGLTGAKYQVFFKNKEGKYEALTLNGENVVFTTGKEGLDDQTIPYGKYYVKEIEAPEKHEVDPNYIEVNIGSELNFAIVNDPKIKGKIVVQHKDIDTDLDIFDPEHSINDIDEPYTTTDRLEEINNKYTPDFDIYELVEEKIPENKDGVYEEEEQTIVYYYRRLKGKLTVIKKDAETGERLEGCIFTIEDAITGEILVENAVTDENGEYTIEEAPYGRYVFTEVQAPEGYEVEEGSVGAVFDVKTEETIFEIVNTGDIQVIVLSIIAIVSVIGIGIVAKKKLLN